MSAFGIVVQQLVNEEVQIVYADSLDRPLAQEAVNLVLKLAQKHRVFKIFVDGSAVSFIADLKKAYGENRYYYKFKPEVIESWIKTDYPRVVPVHFVKRHKEMLQLAMKLMEERVIKTGI